MSANLRSQSLILGALALTNENLSGARAQRSPMSIRTALALRPNERAIAL